MARRGKVYRQAEGEQAPVALRVMVFTCQPDMAAGKRAKPAGYPDTNIYE
jgi:hypothetical protein